MQSSCDWRLRTLGYLIALTLLSGCNSNALSFKARKEFSIHDVEVKLAARNRHETLRTLGTNIIRRLEMTAPRDLVTPTIASALFTKAGNGDLGLLVYWTEDRPSVDGVSLMVANEEDLVRSRISDDSLRANRTYEDRTFLFGHLFNWKRNSPDWEALKRAGEGKAVRVRLTRAGVSVTDWFDPTFYTANAGKTEQSDD